MDLLELKETAVPVDVEALVRRARASTGTRTLASWVRRAVKDVGLRTGLTPAVQRLWSGEAVVLMYHKVQRRPGGLWGEEVLNVEAFDAQMAYLARNYTPISLSHLSAGLRGLRPLPARPAVVTFDDGYRNNLLLAAPVLRRHRVPATLFVTTGFIGTDAWMWAYELEEMLLRFDPAAVARASGSSAIASICSARQPRSVLAAACVEYLKQVSFLEQSRVMHRLRRELAVEVDDENRFLSWDEVREIRTYGVEIGAHTVNHPILVRVPVEEAEREIAGSVRRLEEELGERPKLFAYPNGDTSPAVTALARRYFEAAVTTRDGLCGPDADLHEIPRIGAPNTVTELSFELSRRFVKAGRLSLETGGGQVPLTRDLASDWAEYGAVLR